MLNHLMYKNINILFGLFVFIGILGNYLDPLGENRQFYKYYTTLLQLYLLGFSAYLALKWILLQREGRRITVYRLSKKSNYRFTLLLHGVLAGLLFVTLQHKYAELVSTGMLVVFLLLSYYLAQVVLHGTPTVFLTESALVYDHYFISRWPWKEMEAIELGDHELRVRSASEELCIRHIDLEQRLVEELDREVARGVLDGSLSSGSNTREFLELMQEQARKYGVSLVEG